MSFRDIVPHLTSTTSNQIAILGVHTRVMVFYALWEIRTCKNYAIYQSIISPEFS